MSGDGSLVGSLVERLTSRLPHRTGAPGQDLRKDEIAVITRTTLIKISASAIAVVLENLVALLEELNSPYQSFASHPPHVLLSELYVLALASDCCSAHWETWKKRADPQSENGGQVVAQPVGDGLVNRIFDLFKLLLEPLPEGFVLPAKTILDEKAPQDVLDSSVGKTQTQPQQRVGSSNGSGSDSVSVNVQAPEELFNIIEPSIRTITEYLTATCWQSSFDYLRGVIYRIRTAVPSQLGAQPSFALGDDDKSRLGFLRLLPYGWLDGQKLGLVTQELCSSFLHFRQPFQDTIAIVVPLMIMRWLNRYPDEFVKLHNTRRRLDGGFETLFDMAQTIAENTRRRAQFYPLQTALLLLVPEVFEIASNFREAKSSAMTRRVQFLDALRKGMKNRNEPATHCLVSLLWAVRHFGISSDTAILSYAMDVQDEVRDAVFEKFATATDGPIYDQDLTTAAFISLIYLNLEISLDTLTQVCLDTSAPQTFKIALLQACWHFARQPNPERYEALFEEASGFIQTQLKAVSTMSTDMYIGDRTAQRKASETTAANTTMVGNILKFLDASPMALVANVPSENTLQFYQESFEAFVSCLVSANDETRALASNVAKRLLVPDGIISSLRKSERLDVRKFRARFWKLTSLILLRMCESAQEGDESAFKSIHGYLESRILLLSSVKELAEDDDDVPERAAATSKFETLCLISLCSADIETYQIVTSCISLFTEECRIVADAADAAKPQTARLRNSDVFAEIASRDFRFTGVVAFQKRLRLLLRSMQQPSAGILDAWDIAFERWMHLSRDVSTVPEDDVDDRSLSEWRNYSGFLASLGGICTAEQAFVLEEPAVSGLTWIDKLTSEHYEETLLSRFLRLSIQLLACTNVRVRESMRDVLSTDICSVLLGPLFKALEHELEVLFTGALEESDLGTDREIIFAEQTASLLKALIDRLKTPSELGAASSIHLGLMTLSFAKFVDGVADSTSSARVRIKVCQLCEAVMRKKEHLNLRDDVRIRNQLLEYLFSWISRPRSPRPDNYSRHDELLRLQKDLDKACLRSLAELTYRLPLQPGDGQNDAGTSELKSQMFHTYFNRFLSLLNYEPQDSYRGDLAPAATRDETTSTADLAITILSNLLSANIDVGLQHSLGIGYHENVDIRTAFVKVLYNILMQGTEFSNLSDAAVNEKYDELLELLTHDLHLAVAISSVCPSGEVDELTIALLNIFESRGMTFELMEALIKQEIEETENEAELLRRNCVATKMLSLYGKWKGAHYLRSTLQKVVERLMLTSKDLDLELDPARVQSMEEAERNALQLKVVAKVFIDDICASSVKIPSSFRKICSSICSAVQPRFPEAKYTAVGAFIFLRFFCPAIVAPEAEGLVAGPPSKEMRRGLLLIAKVIQNLANNVLFGVKEPYMYPLNDFLTQNIFRVTTFLREISVPPDALDTHLVDTEGFDFGSCVALHRFLYDHWDHVRQRLMSQERRDLARSPSEVARGRTPVLEPLRALVANLGPPPLAVTWNRPQISANTPVAYSRFQHFMLRNAFRSTESFATSRAIYDGGESKDGMSIICVILRNFDAEAMDFDTVLFVLFKLASRLWHHSFGVLIDATCFTGHGEGIEEFIRKIELLSPTEFVRGMQRIYVYNMNSAFRKLLRRVLRVACRNDRSILNPNNTDINLIGNLQELQTHFHLSQLHLPKDTISVVTDTRYVFQPVTRLSKTKGKIDVTIKVGSQFVQVTTAKKQEVHSTSHLYAVVNDVFRLGEVEEAPTSIPTEDDSAFGLRADGGKIVMFFQTTKKIDVLQAIRSAKSKYGKDPRAMRTFERLVRPQDVPGTLLNLALTNLASADAVLRLASYNLLGALCGAFKFKAASKFMCIGDISVPLDPTQFIVNISKRLAQEEPQLTADFLNEFFVGWESFSDEQKPLSLAYMAPWLPGLRTSLLGDDSDGEKGKEKIASIFRKLIDVTINDPTLGMNLEHTVWPAIYKDETLLDIFFDEILKAALRAGLYDEQTQILTTIITAIGTITLRGKVISRLRKALNRSSQRPTKYLPDNAVWGEICILLQFCLSLSFDCGVQSQLYLPEIFHIVTMLANTGPADIRLLVHRLLINSIHAACTSFKLDDAKLTKLRAVLETLSDPKNDIFSPPVLPQVTSFPRDGISVATSHESGHTLSSIESLAVLLFDVCSTAAPSMDMSNAWRSRWMSLVASTAFQNNPAIQPRAFTVMGCLAREEVDDDLLYQVLVALRNALGKFAEDSTNNEMLVAIVTSLSKMMGKLMTTSRYGLQLFWLAMSLLRLVPPNLFNCAANFLEAVLTNIGTLSEVRSEKMAQVLLQGRAQLEEAALPLDEAYGIHFSTEYFHEAVCACLLRGLTDGITKANALRVLASFLEMTTGCATHPDEMRKEMITSPYLAIIHGRVTGSEEAKEILWLAGINNATISSINAASWMSELDNVRDKDLLLNAVLPIIDFQFLEPSVQIRILHWLTVVTLGRPSVGVYLCPVIAQILEDVLLHCQVSTTLEAAHQLLKIMTANPEYTAAVSDHGALNEKLEEMGFGGIWKSCSFSQTQELDKQCFVLTEKLIELIII